VLGASKIDRMESYLAKTTLHSLVGLGNEHLGHVTVCAPYLQVHDGIVLGPPVSMMCCCKSELGRIMLKIHSTQ